MTSSNFVGCSTARSAGRAFENPVHVYRTTPDEIGHVHSIAQQGAGLGELPEECYDRQSRRDCEFGEFGAMWQESTSHDCKAVYACPRHVGKCTIELFRTSRFEELKAKAQRLRGNAKLLHL